MSIVGALRPFQIPIDYLTFMELKRKFYFYFTTLLLLSTMLSCEEKKEDKYPNFPLFPNTSNPDFEIVKFHSKSGVKFKNFIYQEFLNSGMGDDSVVVQDLEYNKLKTIPVMGFITHIDEFGQIFSVKDSSAYKYKPPKFEKKKLKYRVIKNPYDSIRAENRDLDSRLIYKLKDSVIKSKLTKGLKCIIQLSDYRYHILKYENESVLVKNLDTNLEALACEKANQQAFQGAEITPFDEIHLGYYLDGSNHIAIGVGSKKLYYYKYIIDQDTMFFKDTNKYIQTFKTPKGKILFMDGKHDIYELIKK